MFKIMLYGIFSLIGSSLYADVSAPELTAKAQNAAPEKVAPANQQNIAPKEIAATETPDVTGPADDAIELTPKTEAGISSAVINCNYKIPADMKTIDEALIKQWAEKAAQQSFNFDYKTTDEQLAQLKICFTDQGWQSFNDALQKSGNMNAIKTQQLMVSSMVEGNTTTSVMKENQWKVSVPLQVVYQNSKEKITQRLTIDLIVGRKISGDLGIVQMIASPNQTGSSEANAAANVTPAAAQP